jgi:hypothetical protein
MEKRKVDTVPAMMSKDFGTTVLVTDPKSDYYLWLSEKRRKAEALFVERIAD